MHPGLEAPNGLFFKVSLCCHIKNSGAIGIFFKTSLLELKRIRVVVGFICNYKKKFLSAI